MWTLREKSGATVCADVLIAGKVFVSRARSVLRATWWLETDVLENVGARPRAGRRLIMIPIRLAILLCDTPVPPVLNEHGDYQKIFTAWLRAASPSVDFTLEAFDVVNKMEYPPEDFNYDGILLTGSGPSICLSPDSTFRSDALSQPLRRTKMSNGLISW